MSRELLQQALGALGTSTWDHTRAVGKQELITALRAALAQPEPVASIRATADAMPYTHAEVKRFLSGISSDAAAYGLEVVDHMNGTMGLRAMLNFQMPDAAPTPPAAPAPALTDAEIDRIADSVPVDDIGVHITTWHRRFARAILAAPIDGFGGNLDEAFERAGMVMVPREPTEAMCISGDKARHSVVTQARTSAIYRAMIAAAPAPAVPSEAALNTLARLFHNGEEIEGDDGAAMMVDMALWHEAYEAFDSLIGDGDGETLASSAAPAVPLTDERAAFEAWIRKDSGDLATFGSGPNMHYRNSAVNNAWTGWQARAHGIGGGGK